MEIKSTQDINEALKSGKHLAVKFGASWCNPCKAFKPVFDKVTLNMLTLFKHVSLTLMMTMKAFAKHSALEACRQQSCLEQMARQIVL